MTHHDSALFFDINNTVNEYNGGATHYLLFIPNNFDIYFSVNQEALL